MKIETLLPRAIAYAVKAHEDTNHRYDESPYSLHLALAAHYGERYIHIIPAEDREKVMCGVWLHDTLEDCRITYNDLKKAFGIEISEMIYAVTNMRGRTRSERASEEYYQGIRETPYASFIKLCDRMANYSYSISRGNSRMKEVYDSEMADFIKKVTPADSVIDYSEMIKDLASFTE